MKRTFDGKIWKAGNSLVITIPPITLERFGLKSGDFLTVAITDEEIESNKRGKK